MIYRDFAYHYQPLLTIILGNGPWTKYDGDYYCNYHYQPVSTMMTGMMDNLYDWDMNGITNYNDL